MADGLDLRVFVQGPRHPPQPVRPLVWCWDNLSIHLAPELAEFAEENKAWLRIYRLPAYTPDLNPVEASGRCSSGP